MFSISTCELSMQSSMQWFIAYFLLYINHIKKNNFFVEITENPNDAIHNFVLFFHFIIQKIWTLNLFTLTFYNSSSWCDRHTNYECDEKFFTFLVSILISLQAFSVCYVQFVGRSLIIWRFTRWKQ